MKYINTLLLSRISIILCIIFSILIWFYISIKYDNFTFDLYKSDFEYMKYFNINIYLSLLSIFWCILWFHINKLLNKVLSFFILLIVGIIIPFIESVVTLEYNVDIGFNHIFRKIFVVLIFFIEIPVSIILFSFISSKKFSISNIIKDIYEINFIFSALSLGKIIVLISYTVCTETVIG